MSDFYGPGSALDLVAELEASRHLQDEKKIHLFSCACCRLIFDKLPPVAQRALELAEDFSKGLVRPKRLEAERIKLWDVLGEDSCKFDLPHVNAIRAVICCLFERSDLEFAYDDVTGVMDFCNAVEDHEREQYDILQRVFGVS
jgi:hypothetical protein